MTDGGLFVLGALVVLAGVVALAEWIRGLFEGPRKNADVIDIQNAIRDLRRTDIAEKKKAARKARDEFQKNLDAYRSKYGRDTDKPEGDGPDGKGPAGA